MKIFFAIFAVLLIWTSAEARPRTTTSVGNGGSGFLIDGKVYVSDLVLAGRERYEVPWIGKNDSNPFFSAFDLILEDNPSNTIAFPRQILIRKLIDLEKLSYGLGYLVVEAINAHTWTYIDHPLARTCDSSNIIDESLIEGKIVQIANRHDRWVRIDRKWWDLMADEQRLALIIHEAVYSLVKPTKPMNNGCYPPDLVHFIVQQAFTPNSLPLPGEVWWNLKPGFGVRVCTALTYARKGAYLSLTLAADSLGQRRNFSHNVNGPTHSLKNVFDSLCGEVEAARPTPDAIVTIMSLRKPYWTTFTSGDLRFFERPMSGEGTMLWRGREACTKDLAMRVEHWINRGLPGDVLRGAKKYQCGVSTPL